MKFEPPYVGSYKAKPLAGEFALFCNPESRRAEGFAIALGRVLRQQPRYVPWQWVLEGADWEKCLEGALPQTPEGRAGCPQPAARAPQASHCADAPDGGRRAEDSAPYLLGPPRFLRLESPGRNWRVEQLLLGRGATLEDEESHWGWRRMPAQTVATLTNDPGRVLPMRQWFLGWRQTLQQLSAWAAQRGWSARWLCPPEDVLCMCDKLACQWVLERAGIAVPPALGLPGNFDELWEMMRQAGRRRVFLKPCHGSSASGVVALEASRTDIQAFSTLELVDAPDGLRLYNRRRIQVRRGAAEVRRLVDAVCGERCLAQVWVPKAGFAGCPFDLRVVVIGRRARQVMLRLGRGPMTNSQLLGGKGDVEALRARMGEEAWLNLLGLCEEAMQKAFPRSLYAGFDVLIEPNFRTARILEVNAFGDLLPRTLCEGRETYEWEVEEALKR